MTHTDNPAAGLPDYLWTALRDADKSLAESGRTPGRSYREALEGLDNAVRRHGTEQARRGAYVPGRPENQLEWDGTPRFRARESYYLRRVRAAITHGDPGELIGPWITDTCPDCDAVITGDGIVEGDTPGISHVLIGGAVVIGCGGAWLIPPSRVGLPAGDWQDWRTEEEAARRAEEFRS
jgi:hypothetical protein